MFNTIPLFGTLNFSNSATGTDSNQFTFTGSGFLLSTYPGVKFEKLVIQTNYNPFGQNNIIFTFPTNFTASNDSSIFTLVVTQVGTTGSRRYRFSIYKYANISVNNTIYTPMPGSGSPAYTPTLVTSYTIGQTEAAWRMPAYGTSFQMRATLYARKFGAN